MTIKPTGTARGDLAVAITRIVDEHELSYRELLSILEEAKRTWTVYAETVQTKEGAA